MTPPPLRVKLLGYPLVSFGLLAGCACIFWLWHSGQMPFILALMAVFPALKAADAFDERREFHDWQRRLRDEGEDAANAYGPRLVCLGVLLRVVLALAVVYWATVHQAQLPERSIGAHALRGVRWVVLLYLAVVFGHLILAWYRRKKRNNALAVTEPEPVFVSWLLDVPAYSPSRADAERELPEYCARLLK